MRGTPEEEGYIAHDGPTTNNEGNTIGSGADRTLEGLKDPKLMFSITERSVHFMERQVQSEKPFYLQDVALRNARRQRMSAGNAGKVPERSRGPGVLQGSRMGQES